MNNQNNPFFVLIEPLISIGSALTKPSIRVTSITEYSKARLTAAISLILLILAIIGLVALPASTTGATEQLGILIALTLFSYLLSRTRWHLAGAYLLVLAVILPPYTLLGILNNTTHFSGDEFTTNVRIFVPIGIIIASGLLTSIGMFWTVTLNLIAIPFVVVFVPDYTTLQAATDIGILMTFGYLLLSIVVYRQSAEQKNTKELEKSNKELESIRASLEAHVESRTLELNRRSTQLEASALVARAAAESRNLEDVLNSVVKQITERFGYYHAGLFLTDSARQFVVLQAASSEGGRTMLARGHKLEIGRQGIVGYAAYQKRPRIAQDVGADAVYFNNPFLPDTHSEIALPLVVQSRLVGVLDIQSRDRNAFAETDVYTLQTMADQIALAIENARLLAESHTTLEELRRVTSQNTSAVWRERLSERKIGYTYTPLGINPSKEEIQVETGENQVLIPVRLRGQKIGTIALKRKKGETHWTAKEQDLVEKIADQVALAIDNARLLEDSQRRAAREQTINELTSRFGRSLDVDTLLQNAVRELHRIPQVAEVSVYLKSDDE